MKQCSGGGGDTTGFSNRAGARDYDHIVDIPIVKLEVPYGTPLKGPGSSRVLDALLSSEQNTFEVIK